MLSLSKHARWHDRGRCFDKLSMTLFVAEGRHRTLGFQDKRKDASQR
jgi:hypothetical protein